MSLAILSTSECDQHWGRLDRSKLAPSCDQYETDSRLNRSATAVFGLHEGPPCSCILSNCRKCTLGLFGLKR